MTTGSEAAAPGWYPDPTDAARQRYWDGAVWTDYTNETVVAEGVAGRPYAAFWERLVGLIIDAFVVGIPVGFVAVATIALSTGGDFNSVMSQAQIVAAVLVVAVVGVVAQGAYFVVGLHKFGRTVGGQVMGIRCVDENGNYPTWGQSFIRWGVVQGFNLLGYIPLIGLLSFPLLLVNYLAMLWSPKKQCWMDLAARTYVVKAA